MRRGESFVQVQVHDIDAEVAGTGFADEGIHVRAVHVEERASVVENVGDVVDLVFEDADLGIQSAKAAGMSYEVGSGSLIGRIKVVLKNLDPRTKSGRSKLLAIAVRCTSRSRAGRAA